MKSRTLIILLLVSHSLWAQNEDTLFIGFDRSQIGKSVFINTINAYGDSIQHNKTSTIVFLFSNEELILKLKTDEKKYAKKVIKIQDGKKIKMVGYTSGPPSYGVELDHYFLSKEEYERYRRLSDKKSKLIEKLEKQGADKNSLKRLKKKLYENLSIPLKQLYVQPSFLKKKNVFIYGGSKKDYTDLVERLRTHRIVYVIMPFDFSKFYNFRYLLIQVRRRPMTSGM